jgi:trehalose synthase
MEKAIFGKRVDFGLVRRYVELMHKILLALLPVALLAKGEIESQSMLFQAEEVARRFAQVSSKAPTPSLMPQSDALLQLASNWFSIDLAKVKTNGISVLATLAKEEIWENLAELGIQAVELKNLKLQDGALVSLKINPKWGGEAEYAKVASMAMRKEIRLIGSMVGGSTGKGADFALALKNYRDYPGLYAMVEVEAKDWAVLPNVQPKTFSVNIPWLTLQTLHKLGYVPKDYVTYVKESLWNATETITGADGKSRRWIYLRDEAGRPRLDWLRPSYASERLAAGDALLNIHQLGQKIFGLEESLPESARQDLSLTVRKMNAYSSAHVNGGVAALREMSADLLFDHITPIAAFHALIAEDAEALKLMYRLLLEENVQPKKLVHALQPFSGNSCDWAEFLALPKKKYPYYEYELTGEALRRRLLNEDLYKITGQPTGDELNIPTWAGACDQALSFEELDKRRLAVLETHLLIAKFFAWQPGAFSLSAEDLLGATQSQEEIDLIGPNLKSLYPCLSSQLKNPNSFASQLKRIIRARRDYGIEQAELIDIPYTNGRGVLVLRYRLAGSGFPALLAINFSRQASIERCESSDYIKTTAIDLFTQLAENKFFDSSLFELKLDPLSAKLILFQPTYYKK